MEQNKGTEKSVIKLKALNEYSGLSLRLPSTMILISGQITISFGSEPSGGKRQDLQLMIHIKSIILKDGSPQSSRSLWRIKK